MDYFVHIQLGFIYEIPVQPGLQACSYWGLVFAFVRSPREIRFPVNFTSCRFSAHVSSMGLNHKHMWSSVTQLRKSCPPSKAQVKTDKLPHCVLMPVGRLFSHPFPWGYISLRDSSSQELISYLFCVKTQSPGCYSLYFLNWVMITGMCSLYDNSLICTFWICALLFMYIILIILQFKII